ncbi:histidine phosphatase family protein [Thalassiella azotivora]
MREVRLHLVRHGESTWNAERRLQGQTPHVPLTERGVEQARWAAGQVARLGCDVLVSSDLVRARQTADVLAAATGVPVAEDVRLREQHLGALQGRCTDELVAEPTPPGAHVCEVRWGGGESVADVHSRVGGLLAELVADPPGHDVVLVSHGDTLRVALAWLGGRGPRDVEWVELPNGSVTTVRVGAGTVAAHRADRPVSPPRSPARTITG